ncbi:hypothetical protein [Faecalicatena faecalis]|nr:hypothetical protein [Faecalicatena faecalis]
MAGFDEMSFFFKTKEFAYDKVIDYIEMIEACHQILQDKTSLR